MQSSSGAMASPGYDTILPACSLEFCPSPGQENIFAVGTYKLEDSISPDPPQNADSGPSISSGPQRRRGECLLFEMNGDSEEGTPTFRELSRVASPAILDMKWCHRTSDQTALLGIADSEGHITLHEWNSQDKCLELRQKIECATSDVLCLSMDWANRREPTSTLSPLAVSLSDRTIAILRPDASGLAVTDTWYAHDFEPWIVAWNYWDLNVLYSGGDDLKLKAWDIRQGFEQPTFTNKRFDGGVTTIQSHPFREYMVAVGSYDASVRLFDMRHPNVPVVTTDVGGGVWRVKWNPNHSRKDSLLAACMHDGFKVLDFTADNNATMSTAKIASRFANGEGKTVIGSCSFYDHLLHVWRG